MHIWASWASLSIDLATDRRLKLQDSRSESHLVSENKSNLLQAQSASTASLGLYMDRHGNQRNTPSALAGISQDVDTDLEEVGFCVAVHPNLALLTSFVGVAHPRPADEHVTAH
jgi:hypothetical protein